MPGQGSEEWRRIERTLVTRGLWDDQVGVGRKARASLCRRCRAPVMAGLDHDRCALTAICDPFPLSALGECSLLLMNRPTYSLRWISDHYVLNHRDQWSIAGRPAGAPGMVEVLGEHLCHYRHPETFIAAYAPRNPRPDRKADNDQPDF